MTDWFATPKRLTLAVASVAVMAAGLWASPSFAKDPFRTTDPHAIGDQTEAAFNAVFRQGDYVAARPYLEKALQNEASDPLPYSLRASLAYMESDWDNFKRYATDTREVAEKLKATDPLRGNLYVAVGHFLEGAYAISPAGAGPVKGSPQALSKLQQVFDALDQAAAIDENDPELNLVKGYMDLMVAVYLPFAKPGEAIERMEKYAGPQYLAYRGIALGQRDLDQQTEALESVEKALAMTPDNPELHYLKAQILVRSDQDSESLAWFNKALEKQAQLLPPVVKQIKWEACRAENRVKNLQRSCQAIANQ